MYPGCAAYNAGRRLRSGLLRDNAIASDETRTTQLVVRKDDLVT